MSTHGPDLKNSHKNLRSLGDLDSLAPLRVEALFKRMDGFDLKAHFSVRLAERVALVAPSGAGKTTLLRLLAGLDRMTAEGVSGQVFLGDSDLTHLPPQKREVGFVFQDLALFDSMNVLENVSFGLRLRKFSQEQCEAESKIWLKRVNLASQIQAPISHLSGGEKQRVALIRALIWKPRLILLDEPFSALDRDLKETVMRELVSLHELWPAPMLWVTHDDREVKAVATSQLDFRVDELGVRSFVRNPKVDS